MSPRTFLSMATVLGLFVPRVAEAAPATVEPTGDVTSAEGPASSEAAEEPGTEAEEGPEPSEAAEPAEGASAESSATATETAPAAAATPAPKASLEPAPGPARPPEPEPTKVAEPEPKDDCRDDPDASPLLPKRELDIVCPHEVNDRMTYKVGTGLVIKSKDGRFSMAPRLRAQMLWTVENDNEADATTQGLQIRRARLQFKGHFFGEHNKFKTELAFSPRDESFDGTPHRTPLLDWYFDFDHLKSLTLRVGQYKVPFSRQRVISSGDLELVDRALAQGEFNLDRDIGFDLRSKDFMGWGKLRYYAGVWMGEGRDYSSMDTFELMYIGRLELLPMGQFQDYKEADFERSRKPRLSIGAAYAFVDAAKRNRGILGSTPTDGGTTDVHNVTADFVFKLLGLSVSGEGYFRQGIRSFGDATELDDAGNEVAAPRERPRDGMGWYLQAGYLIPRLPLQVAGRYSQVRRLDSDTSSLPNRDEVGGGLSWYFAHHPLKLQLDYFRAWEEHEIVLGSDRVRLQLQAAF